MTDNLKDTSHQKTSAVLSDAMDRAHQEAQRTATNMAEQVSDEAETAADAAETAAEGFADGSLQELAATQLAQHLQSAAAQLRATDLESAASGVSRFARENPALFLGGAALFGFAIGRFLQASDGSAADHTTQSDEDPWTGHVTSAAATQSQKDQHASLQSARYDRPNGRANA